MRIEKNVVPGTLNPQIFEGGKKEPLSRVGQIIRLQSYIAETKKMRTEE